jgi:hypothetical protein
MSMNKLITTSNKAIAPAGSFADLELVPLPRPVSQRTGLEELLAAVYRQRFVIMAAIALALIVGTILTLTSTPQLHSRRFGPGRRPGAPCVCR